MSVTEYGGALLPTRMQPDMSLRDYIAVQALVGILSGTLLASFLEAAKLSGRESDEFIAAAAYEMADVMMSAREKSS